MPKLVESPKLMDLEPYGSIMSLLEICRNHHPKYNGLTHAHFLYALMEKPKINKLKKEEIRKYFEQLKIPRKRSGLVNNLCRCPKINHAAYRLYDSSKKELLKKRKRKGEGFRPMVS